jgi:hypothetical protein
MALDRLRNRLDKPKTSCRGNFFGTWFHHGVRIHYSMGRWFGSIPLGTSFLSYWLIRGLARDFWTDAIDDSSNLGTHPHRRNRDP